MTIHFESRIPCATGNGDTIALKDFMKYGVIGNPHNHHLADNNGGYNHSLRQARIRLKDFNAIYFTPMWQQMGFLAVEHTTTHKIENALELGCGPGRFFHTIKCKNLYGIDGSLPALNEATQHLGLQQGFKTGENNLPYETLFLVHSLFSDVFTEESLSERFEYIFSANTIGMPVKNAMPMDELLKKTLTHLLAPKGTAHIHLKIGPSSNNYWTANDILEIGKSLSEEGVIDPATVTVWPIGADDAILAATKTPLLPSKEQQNDG